MNNFDKIAESVNNNLNPYDLNTIRIHSKIRLFNEKIRPRNNDPYNVSSSCKANRKKLRGGQHE